MKHFAVEQWLDFVRGLAGAEDRLAMEQHLSHGCEKCSAIVRGLRKFAAGAIADARYKIPDWASRSARNVFRGQAEKALLLPRLVAHLVFDSIREPELAGVRSQKDIMHQVMYEAGNYCVDLRMEHERGAASLVLVGQVANCTQPEDRISGVPVMLMSGKEIVGRTVSSGSGEFQVHCPAKKSLRLCVPLWQVRKRIEIPLKSLLDVGRRSDTSHYKSRRKSTK